MEIELVSLFKNDIEGVRKTFSNINLYEFFISIDPIHILCKFGSFYGHPVFISL